MFSKNKDGTLLTPMEEAELWVAKRGYVTRPTKGVCKHAVVVYGRHIKAHTRKNLIPFAAAQIERHRAKQMREAIRGTE
jgi:hypothetical protein